MNHMFLRAALKQGFLHVGFPSREGEGVDCGNWMNVMIEHHGGQLLQTITTIFKTKETMMKGASNPCRHLSIR